MTLALVMLAGVAVVLGFRSASTSPPGRPAPANVAPARLLAKEPYAGVACRVPNSITCDRLGLAVWTRSPVRSVRATVGGRAFALDHPEWAGRPRMFGGFLRHADLRALGVRTEGGDHWTGAHPVRLRVRLVVTGADGSERATVVPVTLSPGWG